MVLPVLAAPDLAAGALVRPFEAEVATGLSLVLERPEGAGATPWLDRIVGLLSAPEAGASRRFHATPS